RNPSTGLFAVPSWCDGSTVRTEPPGKNNIAAERVDSMTQQEVLERYRVEQKTFDDLRYCEKVFHSDPKTAPAVLLFLHGAGERGENNVSQLCNGVAEYLAYLEERRISCVLLAPQCPAQQMWTGIPWSVKEVVQPPEITPVLDTALRLVAEKIKEYHADATRVYISGVSMGGFGTWDAISRRPELFAGAFPVCGGGDPKNAVKLAKLPLLTYHGSFDQVVSPDLTRKMVAALRAAGSSVRYVEVPGRGHDSWVPAFADPANFDWLFAQRKG
ncbi:MAG: hypothetical protein PHS41_03510, partial [Victivallaceae bacterium]|nr:hypothetical protein [Victivallaceae bacterium]